MSYDVQFTGPARRAMQGVPPRIVAAIIEFAYGALSSGPRRVGKPLVRELAGLFSARRGPYRLVYRIDDEERGVYIVHIDHRADIYRRR